MSVHCAAYDRRYGTHTQRGHIYRRRAFAHCLAALRRRNKYVYSKPPLGEPAAVLVYLSRCTHPVAIANRGLIAFDQNGVAFSYKDYRAGGRARYKDHHHTHNK